MNPFLAQAADPAAVREAVGEVLGRPEYADVDRGESLIDRALSAIGEVIGRILLRLGQAADGPEGTVGFIAVVLLVGVLLVAIVVALSRFRRGGSTDTGLDEAIGRSAPDWGEQAEAHARAGEWTDALRCRYRQALAELAAAGLVAEVPGRTTGEYAAAVRTAVPPAAADFDELTRAFERAWYGRRRVGAEDLAAAEESRRAVLAATRARR